MALKKLLVPLYLPAALAYLSQGLTTSFIVLYALELGAPPAAAGLIAALPHIGTIVFDLPAGSLSDRVQLKGLYLAATVCMATAALLIGLLHSLYLLAPLLILFGAARTFWSISQVSMVRRLVAPESRGRALALMGGMVRIGSFAGPAAGGYLAAVAGLAPLFLVASLLLLSASLLILFITPSTPSPGIAPAAPRGLVKSFRRHRRVLLTAGTGIVILGLLRSARPVLLPLYGEMLGLRIEQIGLVMGLGGLADTLLFYPAGVIYDRFGIRSGAILTLCLFSLGMLLLPLASGFYPFLAAAILIGIGNGFGAGINMTFSASLAPDDEVGGFMGIWRLFTDAGTVGGPLLAGGITALAGLGAAPLVLGAVGIAGAGIFARTVPARTR